MAKNHYVSQFIIKRFSDAINVFDVHSGKIDESKRPHKVFYKDNIYDGLPTIKMISIDRYQLDEARRRLDMHNE